MPMHNWKRVAAGIYHAFHHEWISQIARALNERLPGDFYALPEQQAARYGPDVLTLKSFVPSAPEAGGGTTTALARRPKTRFTAVTDNEFHRLKKSAIVVRHVSGDRMVAVVEIVSPGNKSDGRAFRLFVEKACDFLQHGIHLLIVDPFPPTERDPRGVHAAIWEENCGESFDPPAEQPLTLVSYECGPTTCAEIEPFAVGEPLADMPLSLEPDGFVAVPLESTYVAAFAALPRRWRDVLDAPAADHPPADP